MAIEFVVALVLGDLAGVKQTGQVAGLGSTWKVPHGHVWAHGLPNVVVLRDGLESVEQHDRDRALQNAVHPVMAELADWLDLVLGQQSLVQEQGMGIPCPAGGLLPPVELSSGPASGSPFV